VRILLLHITPLTFTVAHGQTFYATNVLLFCWC